MIKNEGNYIILKKVISVDSLSSTLDKNQHLYVVNPEGSNSKFNEELLKDKNSTIHMLICRKITLLVLIILCFC